MGRLRCCLLADKEHRPGSQSFFAADTPSSIWRGIFWRFARGSGLIIGWHCVFDHETWTRRYMQANGGRGNIHMSAYLGGSMHGNGASGPKHTHVHNPPIFPQAGFSVIPRSYSNTRHRVVIVGAFWGFCFGGKWSGVLELISMVAHIWSATLSSKVLLIFRYFGIGKRRTGHSVLRLSVWSFVSSCWVFMVRRRAETEHGICAVGFFGEKQA